MADFRKATPGPAAPDQWKISEELGCSDDKPLSWVSPHGQGHIRFRGNDALWTKRNRTKRLETVGFEGDPVRIVFVKQQKSDLFRPLFYHFHEVKPKWHILIWDHHVFVAKCGLEPIPTAP